MSRFTDLLQEPTPAPAPAAAAEPASVVSPSPEAKAVGTEKPAAKKKFKMD
jgi:hypothetical protein